MGRIGRRLAVAAFLGALAAIWIVPLALAQDGSPVTTTDTSAEALRTAAGVAAVVALITNILRTVVPADAFDRWGPTIAVGAGIVLAVLGVVVSPGTHDGDAFVTAILVGLFGGWMSQNVNTQVVRAVRPG